mmetsp:Transcript_19285/g.59963  ORF Transcript_19285/g.59963 Transcript_19285/m.59963 type:complete len:310 (+) Transcript_19285:3136-4065(+)
MPPTGPCRWRAKSSASGAAAAVWASQRLVWRRLRRAVPPLRRRRSSRRHRRRRRWFSQAIRGVRRPRSLSARFLNPTPTRSFSPPTSGRHCRWTRAPPSLSGWHGSRSAWTCLRHSRFGTTLPTRRPRSAARRVRLARRPSSGCSTSRARWPRARTHRWRRISSGAPRRGRRPFLCSSARKARTAPSCAWRSTRPHLATARCRCCRPPLRTPRRRHQRACRGAWWPRARRRPRRLAPRRCPSRCRPTRRTHQQTSRRTSSATRCGRSSCARWGGCCSRSGSRAPSSRKRSSRRVCRRCAGAPKGARRAR